jgi:hypothetical protein
MDYAPYFEWYKSAPVKFEIIKFLKNREFALLSKVTPERSTRTLRCHSVQHYDVILNEILKIEQKKSIFNFYYSLATYTNGLPYQNPNLSQRNNGEWISRHYEEMCAYDFLLDIDCDSQQEISYAYESAGLVKTFFDKINMPYELRFSGCGFHFVTPYKYFTGLKKSLNPNDEDSIYALYIRLAGFISAYVSELVDKTIYDSRRICKLPYSIAVYEDKMYVCMPFLNDKDFYNFDISAFELDRVELSAIRGRGNYVFNSMGNIVKLLNLVEKSEMSEA